MSIRKIECSGCNTVYKVDESKIPNKVVRSKCKKCGNVIVINENHNIHSKKQTTDDNSSVEQKLNKEINKQSITVENDTDGNKEEILLPEGIKNFRDKVQSYFKNADGELSGYKKIIYTTIKVIAVYVLSVLTGQLFPKPFSAIIACNLFICLLNWKTLLKLSKYPNKLNLLFKDSWKKFTLPLILWNIVVAFKYPELGIFFAPVILVFLIALPFYINYKLAISRGKSIPLMMFLTLIFSYIITLVLAFSPEVQRVKRTKQ